MFSRRLIKPVTQKDQIFPDVEMEIAELSFN